MYKPTRSRNRDRVNITPFKTVPLIDPLTYYGTGDILRLGLIPGLNNTSYGRAKINGILLYNIDSVRYPIEETTKTHIKTINAANPLSKVARWKVQGIELIKFLKLNNALPK